jgi:bifunctional DNase/RNase
VDTKVKLKVKGLASSSAQSGAYALVLAEAEGLRHVSISVGIAEAQSIAMALEEIVPPRPLTHDLIFSLFRTFDIRLVEVCIYKCEDDIFFSELLLEQEGRLKRVDSRTSDAIAIALRVKCDIYADEKILEDYGIDLDAPPVLNSREEEEEDDEDEGASLFDFLLEGLGGNIEEVFGPGNGEGSSRLKIGPEDIKNEDQLHKWLSLQKDSELTRRMEEAVKNENYEYAKLYMDELSRREKRGGK